MRLLVCWSSENIAIPFFLFALLFTLLAGSPSFAQTQQPFLITYEGSNGLITDIAVFVRNDLTGDLTEVPNSPFTNIHSQQCGPTVLDPKGRFLYGPCGLGTAMYTLDATAGTVAEVAGSPFAASTDTTVGLVAAETTGQYVYVLKASLSDTYPTNSTVILDTFQVDSAGEQLVSPTSLSIPLDGTLVAATASQHGFYLLLNQDQSTGYPVAMLYAILFDPNTGQASAPQSLVSASNNARAMLMDTAAKNLVISSGENCGSLWFLQLSQTDGTVGGNTSVALACEEFATPVAFDPTSTYFYLQFSGSGATETGTRIFDISTAAETTSSPVPASLESEIGGQVDPQGPFGYFSGPAPGDGILVYGVDPTTGYPVSPASFSNPLFPGRDLGLGPATIDVNTQPVAVPAVGLSSTTLSFGSVTVGQSSASQFVTLTNTGQLVLSLTSIQVTGTNAADFTETDTCMSSPQIQPNKSCLITVVYQPAAVGADSATVVITDNASGNPQQIALTGTGTSPGPPPAPAPAVTLNPNPLNFPGTVTEGMVSAPQNVVLTNSGNATLQVQPPVLGGANSGDFAIVSNTCNGQVAANANCVVSLTFSPTGSGVRTATLTFADNASNSPQTLSVNGTGGMVVLIGPASGTGSTSASISAGQTAQFNLQAAAGPSFSGTLTFTCTGVPFVASCTVPTSVSVVSGGSTPFVVTVSTTAASSMLPAPGGPGSPMEWPAAPYSLAWVTLFGVVSLFFLARREKRSPLSSTCATFSAAVAFLLVLILASELGCGGGGGGGSAPRPTSPSSQTTATPALQPAGGLITTGFPSVLITDTTAGSTIYYTTDGSTPTTSSSVYSGAITVNVPATVQALATASGYTTSAVASATYKFQTPSGTSTILLTPTAVATGSSKPIPLGAVPLTLTVK